ncbi:MAG: (4Fe-4S)-binding protein, partial [Halobacteria archaeon]|nr:(4Fe-4S)-binding protein [Halobacteria archaeon]
YEELESYLDEGRDIVVVEPSVASLFVDEYERLLDEEEYERLAERTYEVAEYINTLDAELPSIDADVYLHGHCQQRAVGQFDATERLLREGGCNVTASDVECCGMAGSFGYKDDYYELSMEVGKPLFDDIEGNDAELLACGTSCKAQISDGTGREARHPIEFIAEHL